MIMVRSPTKNIKNKYVNVSLGIAKVIPFFSVKN